MHCNLALVHLGDLNQLERQAWRVLWTSDCMPCSCLAACKVLNMAACVLNEHQVLFIIFAAGIHLLGFGCAKGVCCYACYGNRLLRKIRM